MAKTDRLYYSDSYLREFDARIVRFEAAPNGCKVYLNRTAFYPASGGQPTDLGSLADSEVLEVVDEGDEIAHILRQPPRGEDVHGIIDWARRCDHMQQHTGQHILSAAFEKVGGYHTVSFHLGSNSSSIDLDSDRLGAKQFEEVENTANLVVFEDRPVRISFQTAGEANRLDLRKPTSREGEVRLVEVEGFDLSACGGTHVSRTGAVGLILVRKVERPKGLTRVEFVCGARAFRHARRDFRVLSDAARLFSANLDAVPELIAKESQNLREAMREKEKLFIRLAEYHARELWQGAPEIEGRRLVRLVSPAEESAQAKVLAHALAKLPSTVALVGVMSKPTALFFAQSAGGPSDMGSILKRTIAKFGGKGGGGRDFAQAGGMEESRLEQALAYAETLVKDVAGASRSL